MNQLGGLAEEYSKFEERGAQIIAVAVQSQEEARLSVDNTDAIYPILADSEHAVADTYGVYNRFSDSLAAASVFIIGQDGRIIWQRIAEFPTQRVKSQTILEKLPEAEGSLSKVDVTLNSSVHSSDLGGYAWIQEFLGSNDLASADAQSWTESARTGAVCYASIAPASKSAPSAIDGSFTVTFEAEPGSTFRIMCDGDETHPGALGIDVFTVPTAGGMIDHATAGYLYPGIWSPELGIANELAAQAAGYASAEEMFETAGTCRALALPGEGATIAVSDGAAYGFTMEAPDIAGRVTMLTEPAGAYIVVKEFEAGESDAEIALEFTDTSGAGLKWPTATCPIKKGFSTHLEVLPQGFLTGEAEEATLSHETSSSLNPVTTPGGDQVGESYLERRADKIVLNFDACCVTPGHAYTAWWAIGDVTKPMSAVKTMLAKGWVATSDQVKLAVELEAGVDGSMDTLDGVRIAVLDHGPDTGDPKQLTTPGGGCPNASMCPMVLSTSHPAPQE